MRKIQSGDKVQVMRGKDRGKQGEVLRVVRKGERVLVVVKDVNIVTKHQKPNPTLDIPGGLVKVEAPIDISNVMLLDGGKPSRVGFEIKEGKKTRKTKTAKKTVKK